MAAYVPFADAIQKLEFGLVRQTVAGFACSDLGRERIEALAPLTVFAEVCDELAIVGEMLSLLDADDVPPLATVADCRPALHRASVEASTLHVEDMRSVLDALITFRKLAAFFEKRAERAPFLGHLATRFFTDKMLEYHIDRVIDEEGNVRDSASKELRQIRREIVERSGQLRRRMEHILKRVSEEQLVMEDLVTLRDGRMVLPVKSEFKRMVPGFIHSSSATGQTVYIEPTETLELNNDIRDLQFAEAREIARILMELTDRLRPHVQPLLDSLSAFSDLDAVHARARYALTAMASIPRMEIGDLLEIRQGRHPLLLQHKPRTDVVPLDITIGDEATSIIITGPNAGGKSVAMKTVGLLALMAQSGIPVPCSDESVFPVYRDVFVDIGDEQSVENDLSTFSSHIQRLAAIIERAEAKSLVLIDEIGTGTDPSEGSALGAAILEELTRRRAHVIATTHHGMLKAFAHEHPHMRNAAMEFDVASLQPTYRFRAGLPGSSYAFEITRRHGMEERVIARAREIMGSRSDALEHLLAEVEKKTQDLAEHLRSSQDSERKYRALAEEYQNRLAAAKREAKEIKSQAVAEAEKIVDDANALIENTVRDIREQQASRETVKESHQRVEQFRRKMASERSAEAPAVSGQPERPLHMGDTIALRSNPANHGLVLEEPRGREAAVAFGSLKMRVPVSDLIKIETAAPEQQIALHINDTPPKTEIDLRGMYGDDAVKATDAFLYDAYTAGMKRVDIIHGKGTGALRKRIQEYLRTVPFVESYRLGEWNEGMTGVTVVFLKD